MNQFPTELICQVYNYLPDRIKAKFSCVWNLYKLEIKEIYLLWILIPSEEYLKQLISIVETNYNWDNGKALHYASWYGEKQVVKTLLRAGFDLNSTDKYGNLPIDYAKRWNRKDIIELLKIE